MRKNWYLCALFLTIAACSQANRIDARALSGKALGFPLLYLPNMEYQGAFVLSSAPIGFSRLYDAEGGMAYRSASAAATRGSLFVSGNYVTGGVAEFAIPELVKTTSIDSLPVSETVIQPFSPVVDRSQGNLDYLSDLLWLDGHLIYSVHNYYPASDLSGHQVGVIPNAGNLATAESGRLVRINARSGTESSNSYTVSQSSGWFAPIPTDWRELLGGTHLFGPADGWSVAGRMAAGPSVFAFDPQRDLLGQSVKSVVPSRPLIDYSTENPLDLLGLVGGQYVNAPSDLWNSMSFIHFGYIFPGTRTLMLVGNHWGADDDIGYKLARLNKSPCSGPCPYKQDDASNYYWLIDLRDVVSAVQGRIQYDSIMPYAYGRLDLPFQKTRDGKKSMNPLVGGAFDESAGMVYLQLRGADTRPEYEQRPVFVAYKANMNKIFSAPRPPEWLAVAGAPPTDQSRPVFKVKCGRASGNCKSSEVALSWATPRSDVAGLPVVVDHYRVHFENKSLRYANSVRHQRVGVTVPGDVTELTQNLVPGKWQVTIRAIAAGNVPSRIVRSR